jgi:hypothetical protein
MLDLIQKHPPTNHLAWWSGWANGWCPLVFNIEPDRAVIGFTKRSAQLGDTTVSLVG